MTPPEILGTLESALYAGDLAAAESFYADILGLPVIARQKGRHIFFAAGESLLLVFDPAATADGAPAGARLPVPGHGAKGPGHYCFKVSAQALDAWRTYLEESGVEIEADFAWPNGARSIYVRDPAGNSVEFAPAALWF
ncbi:VOC family protein [Defluviimonas sp. WL0002]|uniref:VOC family protein n=1 Tax=Albidovulum marisflavi TaxID=2984159 RepID=A0ABT2ZIL4_9RHOB|nr:VOC family protein [Defluviimonas sp. WL0002]MCV2870571.1 VOC family protein [Defluviimonas sp. WL0002]